MMEELKKRGRPPATEKQKAATARRRLEREAAELGYTIKPVHDDGGIVEYDTEHDGAPTLALHPFCELFPRLEGSELDELVEDIRATGQREPGWTLDGAILDGANRFVACRALGIKFQARPYDGDNALRFVIAANYRRRHLSIEQRRTFRRGVIKLYFAMSNRLLAELLGVDNKTIAADRAALERTAEFSAVEKRTGIDGKTRKQPAKKPKSVDAAIGHQYRLKQAQDLIDKFAPSPPITHTPARPTWTPKLSEASNTDRRIDGILDSIRQLGTPDRETLWETLADRYGDEMNAALADRLPLAMTPTTETIQ